ncbi:ester cyclase [Agaribacter flavus]|uniref:Ester cyclase n=1 Tax=Agaribacter flavus TaxID=1902781 RepID=A0ABV7FSZ0_9ALTE
MLDKLELNQCNKNTVWDFWRCLDTCNSSDVLNKVKPYIDETTQTFGPDPINELQGANQYIEGFWQPLKHSFPDLSRETFIFFGGVSNGRKDGDINKDGAYWVTGTGNLVGTFARDYLGIPASGKQVSIRWGEFCRVEDNKITHIYYLLDYIDLMQQAGFDVLPPSHGKDGMYLAPKAQDGILRDQMDPDYSAYTLDHMRKFIYEGLNSYDESALESMGMADFFHPDVTWYGPGGIGACYGLKEFEDYHQKIWLHAFPDREVQDLNALIAEGRYSGGPGWAGVIAIHTGEYKGVNATNNRVEINGLDWWRREGEQLVENWVFVDMVHLFRQFNVDLFERLKQQVSAK